MRQLDRWLAYNEEKKQLRSRYPWAEKQPFNWLPIVLLLCMAAGGTLCVLLLSWLLNK